MILRNRHNQPGCKLPAARIAALATVALAIGWQAAPVLGQTPGGTPSIGQAAAGQPAAGTFNHPGVARDAERYAARLLATIKPSGARADALKARAEALAQSNPRAAAALLAEAVVIQADDAGAWSALARALLATTPAPNVSSERYQLPLNASGAAYMAYQHTKTTAERARALVLLSETLKRRSYWRPAIDALATSLALTENADARRAYDGLRAEHGFRITDHRVDSDAAQPRLCVQFSEPLSRANVDFAKFVAVDGKDPQSITIDTRQLCIEGLKHGQRTEVKIRAGLPSQIGETLQKTAEIAAYVRDRTPFVRFSGRNYVLPSRGQNGIPLVAVNTERAEIEIYRIGDRSLAQTVQAGEFQKQLHNWDVERLRTRTGVKVWTGSVETPMTLNAETTTAVPVGEAIGTLKPGAYAMIARPVSSARAADDEGWATQWFVVSDLGLTALTGDDGITAFVRALSSAEAVASATVRLVARNNEVLASAKPDADGVVRFPARVARGEGGLAPQILVAESTAGDYAFLDLTQSAFDLSDRGVKGRPAPGPIDGYVFSERGVYRPGEDVHLTALIRDGAGRAAGLPVTLIVTRPDGVEYRRFALADQGLGGRLTTLGLSGTAMTGTWRAAVHVDPKAAAIAQTAFLLEDFVPERLSLELTSDGKPITPDAAGTIKLAGRYLYGPPAADLAVEGDIVVKPAARDVAGFAGYSFGQADERIAPVRKPLEALANTTADGTATLTVPLPAVTKTARPLSADVIVRLREPGGRTIERTIALPVDLGLTRIGIKPAFGAQGPGEGELATFDAVLVDGQGKQSAGALDWTLYRLDTSWQWFKRDGQWAYEAVSLTRKVADGRADARAAAPTRIAARVDWGRYRLDVTTRGAADAAASLAFTSGWHASAEDADSPEALEVALDKPSYKAGETAKLRMVSRLAGRAVITVLGGGVRNVVTADIAAGGGEIAIPVADDWGPGAYVTAIVYRAMDTAAKRMPARAIGVAWLSLDAGARTLDVKLAAPQKVASGGHLSVPITIGGLTAGEDARITLAAVDVGILNLTRHTAPKPEGWFNAQRRLGVEIRDFYGRLIDGMRAERGKLRTGGDGGGGLAAEGSPPVESLVALHSGIVRVGADGRATVDFNLPDFNGTVRVMAVAWSAAKTGSASADVIVRDPIAVTASTPRFMTLGDDVRIAVDLHNVEAADGAFALAVNGGPVADVNAVPPATGVVQRTVALKAGERRQETLNLKPSTIGPAIYRVRVTGPNGIDVKRDLTFDVKVPAGDIRRTTVSRLAPGASLTVSADLTADLVPERTAINLSVGPFASLDVPGLLTALDRYPYGCAEQTVSRALPLLYANAVATTIGLAKDKAIKDRVQTAITRVYEMQDSAGGFGVWGPFNTDMWLTAYVTDFLSRAKEQGFEVRAQAFAQALDKLQSYVSYAQDFTKGSESRAYALYVLARNGRAPIGELRYFADTRLDRFATPLAQAQLGAALAMMGDKVRAETVFAKALTTLEGSNDESRSDYGSKLRDGAALVTLASETGVARARAVGLVDVIAKGYSARTHTSTQEQAWMLLAANALADQAKATTLTIAGQRVSGPHVRTVTAADLKAGAVTIRNDGAQPVDAVISVAGAALTPEPAISKGFTIARSAFKLDGTPVGLKSLEGGNATLQQNDRLVMVLKVAAKETGGRILLVDRLPAGLEIENPRLVDGGDIKSLPWLKATVKPEHTGFRDDRFVAAFDFFGRRNGEEGEAKDAASQATVAYIVRAVTPGRFVHPAATVEDMYRPERHARSAAGTLTIEAAGK